MFENVARKYEIDQKANIAKFQSNSVAIARKTPRELQFGVLRHR